MHLLLPTQLQSDLKKCITLLVGRVLVAFELKGSSIYRLGKIEKDKKYPLHDRFMVVRG